MAEALFRFYGSLNDFLPSPSRGVPTSHAFLLPASVKDVVESIGVPHPEIDLLLVNDASVALSHRLESGDRVAVYPRFRHLDVAPISLVRPAPLDDVRFVLDTHLGRLAAYLRLAGFDCLYRNDWDDPRLAEISGNERRVLLTRDAALLKRNIVEYGAWVRATDPRRQLAEISGRLDLASRARLFSRCSRCNSLIERVEKSAILDRLPPRTRQHYDEFWTCPGCGRVYWHGGHWERMKTVIGRLLSSESSQVERT